MSKKKWTPFPTLSHVMIDGQVSGLIVAPLPKSAGQNYLVRTLDVAGSFRRLVIHESRLMLRAESRVKA